MGEQSILNLASDESLINCLQKKEKELGNPLSNKIVRENLERLDNIGLGIIKKIEITKGHNAYEHCLETIGKAEKTAQLMNCEYYDVKLIGFAACNHDVGKNMINSELLSKKEQLTLQEYKEIQKHVLFGRDILKPFTYVGNLVLCHHERCDGRGYVQGLSGNNIPLGSRIIAVTDSYNAITHDRGYNIPKPKEFAINELRRCAGLEFDTEYIKNFRLGILKNLSKDSSPLQYKEKLLAILCKKGEFEYDKEKEKNIEDLEKDYLYTRLRAENQFDPLIVEAFIYALESEKKVKIKTRERFGYLEVLKPKSL